MPSSAGSAGTGRTRIEQTVGREDEGGEDECGEDEGGEDEGGEAGRAVSSAG